MHMVELYTTVQLIIVMWVKIANHQQTEQSKAFLLKVAWSDDIRTFQNYIGNYLDLFIYIQLRYWCKHFLIGAAYEE